MGKSAVKVATISVRVKRDAGRERSTATAYRAPATAVTALGAFEVDRREHLGGDDAGHQKTSPCLDRMRL